MKTLAFAFALLSAVSPARAQNVAVTKAAAGRAAGMFPPVSLQWAQALNDGLKAADFMRPGKGIVFGFGKVIEAAASVDSLESRLPLAPFVAQLSAIPMDAQTFRALSAAEQSSVLLFNVLGNNTSARAVDAKAVEALRSGEALDALAIVTYFGPYLTQTRLAELQDLAAKAMDGRVAQIADGLGMTKEDSSVGAEARDGADVLVANARIDALRRSMDDDETLKLVGKLSDQALAAGASEGVQTAIMRGLSARAAGEFEFDDARSIWAAVEKIAVASSYMSVKGEAISRLSKSAASLFEAEEAAELNEIVDRIGASAGGLANIPIPVVPKPTPTAAKAVKNVWSQLSEGAQAHSVGAFFALLVVAGVVSALVTAGIPTLPILAAVALLAYITSQGLYYDHPVANFFQLLIFSDLFAALAKAGPAGLSAPLMLVAGALGAAALAVWSFKSHRPVLGWFLNLVLVGMITSMAFGTQIASLIIK